MKAYSGQHARPDFGKETRLRPSGPPRGRRTTGILNAGIYLIFAFLFLTTSLEGCSVTPVTLDVRPPARPTQVTHGGTIFRGCVEFGDAEAVVGDGYVTRVKVWYTGGYIHGLQLTYGAQEGRLFGFNQFQDVRLSFGEFDVPAGHHIVRVEGDIRQAGSFEYVSRLQFVTDKGTTSPWFGEKRGKPFTAIDPNGQPLRTISGFFNERRHTALHRAIVSMTFYFSGY